MPDGRGGRKSMVARVSVWRRRRKGHVLTAADTSNLSCQRLGIRRYPQAGDLPARRRWLRPAAGRHHWYISDKQPDPGRGRTLLASLRDAGAFLSVPVVSLADSLNHRLWALIPPGALNRTFVEVSVRRSLVPYSRAYKCVNSGEADPSPTRQDTGYTIWRALGKRKRIPVTSRRTAAILSSRYSTAAPLPFAGAHKPPAGCRSQNRDKYNW